MRFLHSLLGIAVMVAGAGTAAAKQGDARTAIDTANQQFVEALSRGDAARLASFYADSAQVFPPGANVVRGREGIQALWKGVVDLGVKSATLTTADVESCGDMAVETGAYEMKGADGSELDHGKYVAVWKRERGEWKLYRDIWNTSVAAAGK